MEPEHSHLLLRGGTLLLGAVVLILLWLAFMRYRQPDTRRSAKWLFLAALGLGLPWYLSQSMGLHFHYMTEPQFCGSCHLMQPYFEDLKDPTSDGLAAKHAQNRRINNGKACYTCHSDYKFMGTLKSKIRGLRHLYADYILDRDEPPKIYTPFPNSTCLTCHDKGRDYLKQADHLENEAEIRSEEVSCLDCHSPAHNPEKFQELQKKERKR